MGAQFLLLPVKMLLLLSCLAATSLSWCKTGCPTLVSLRPMTLASSLSPTTEWSTTAAPPSSPTARRTRPTFPPARRSQEPPASSPSATRASPTTPAPPQTSSPPPGAPQAPTKMEPTFLEVSLSALPFALVLPQQQ